MAATDTFTSQTTTDLERSEHLLRLLAHGYYVGIAETDVGVNCVYCDWHHEKYGAEPLHTEDCPIHQARKLLRRVHAPRPALAGAGSGAGQSRRT